MVTTQPGPDGQPRCEWCLSSPEYIAYHDHEWGFPEGDDQRLFEKISLESFQSGLSWRTILAKREGFRAAFAGFDIDQVARFTQRDVQRLLADPRIVRHRGKIEATIHNAGLARGIASREGSLAAFIWSYEPARQPSSKLPVPSKTPESVALAKDLKKLGWKFLGPTTAYAFMQAIGIVNDHAETCAIRPMVDEARARFNRP